MFLCATFGSVLCVTSASSGRSSQWIQGGGCPVLNFSGHQLSRGMVFTVSPRQAENLTAGHARRGNPNCAGVIRSFTNEFAGEMVSKSRSSISCLVGGGGNKSTVEDWTRKLPAKRKALYSHSLPCIEAWLHRLGFFQVKEDRSVWNIERADWHAELSLDVIDLYIRYLKNGPGNLERDIERKFSYALSREDVENAILGGP